MNILHKKERGEKRENDIYGDGAGGGCWLFGFYGISNFVGYLMPNPFLCK